MQFKVARASQNDFGGFRGFQGRRGNTGVSNVWIPGASFSRGLFFEASGPRQNHDPTGKNIQVFTGGGRHHRHRGQTANHPSMSTLLNLSSRLLSLSKDGWLYIFGHGFLFAGDGLAYESMRITASILLSLGGESFEIEVAGGRQRGEAFLLRPGVWRCIDAPDTPMVSIGLCPTHDTFRAFSTCPDGADAWPLPRALSADCTQRFQAARAGLLSPLEAEATAALVIDRARRLMPGAPVLDARIQRVCEQLDESPNTSMKRLASEVDLSYHRLSHLFSQEMGITLRMYAISRKLDLAATMAGRGLNLTQIAVRSGFADSAHFCRTWMRSFGSPPSQLLGSQKVGIRSAYSRL
jgi:AraC family transcriptional regulator, arabinose operon regulatory protein